MSKTTEASASFFAGLTLLWFFIVSVGSFCVWWPFFCTRGRVLPCCSSFPPPVCLAVNWCGRPAHRDVVVLSLFPLSSLWLILSLLSSSPLCVVSFRSQIFSLSFFLCERPTHRVMLWCCSLFSLSFFSLLSPSPLYLLFLRPQVFLTHFPLVFFLSLIIPAGGLCIYFHHGSSWFIISRHLLIFWLDVFFRSTPSARFFCLSLNRSWL